MSTQAHPYTPLAGTDIRLITIEDNGPQLSVKCHVQRGGNPLPSYYALSYVWGDPSHVKEILLDGIPFQITHNLHAALEMLRSKHPAQTYYWTDAICMNQTDNDEKSRQVQLMGIIYHTATGVFAWLGSEDYRILFDGARSAAELRMKNTDQPMETFFDTFLTDQGSRMGWPILDWCTHEMQKLLQNPFFSRIWIMQEVVLARDCPVMCSGESTVSMDSLLLFWYLLKARGRNTIAVIDTQQSLESLYLRRCLLRRSARANQADTPSDEKTAVCLWTVLLSHTVGHEASWPQDMVYGVLGMLKMMCGKSAIPKHLTPDYNLPFEKVYWDYTRFIIEYAGDLSVLCSNGNQLKDTPTWVPDLRKSAGWLRGSDTIPGRNANTPAPCVSADGKILSIEATRLGFCTAVCPAVEDHAIPNVHSQIVGFEDIKTRFANHRNWLEQRILMVEDKLCKPAIAAGAHCGKTLLQARNAILRPDGLRPPDPDAKALLLNLYISHCPDFSVDTLLKEWTPIGEIPDATRTSVWRWLEMGLSNQLFLTNGGDIGRVLVGTPAEMRVGDEIFSFDNVPLAFVLRKLEAREPENQYTLVACAQLPAAEAHANGETLPGSTRLGINIV
jgi:hypothetical protein